MSTYHSNQDHDEMKTGHKTFVSRASILSSHVLPGYCRPSLSTNEQMLASARCPSISVWIQAEGFFIQLQAMSREAKSQEAKMAPNTCTLFLSIKVPSRLTALPHVKKEGNPQLYPPTWHYVTPPREWRENSKTPKSESERRNFRSRSNLAQRESVWHAI